jgi:hypothetical protein
VDYSRVNEFGQGGADEDEKDGEKDGKEETPVEVVKKSGSEGGNAKEKEGGRKRK